MISREDYIDTQRKLLEIATEVAALPVEEFVEAAALMEGLGVGGRHAGYVRRIAEGALAFKRTYPDLPSNVLADLEQRRRDAIAEAEARFAHPSAPPPRPTVMSELRGQPAFRG